MEWSSAAAGCALWLVATAAVGNPAVPANGASAADWPGRTALRIEAVGFKDGAGKALFALYDSDATWLDPASARVRRSVAIRKGKAKVEFGALLPGTYAVAVIHDANDNGKLDMSWFPYPRPAEGAAVSRDAKAMLGPPSYADAAFAIKGPEQAIRVTVRY